MSRAWKTHNAVGYIIINEVCKVLNPVQRKWFKARMWYRVGKEGQTNLLHTCRRRRGKKQLKCGCAHVPHATHHTRLQTNKVLWNCPAWPASSNAHHTNTDSFQGRLSYNVHATSTPTPALCAVACINIGADFQSPKQCQPYHCLDTGKYTVNQPLKMECGCPGDRQIIENVCNLSPPPPKKRVCATSSTSKGRQKKK